MIQGLIVGLVSSQWLPVAETTAWLVNSARSPPTRLSPTSIVATHWTYGKLDRSRPLCPFPQVAKYIGGGAGDNTDAAFFVCAAPIHGTATR